MKNLIILSVVMASFGASAIEKNTSLSKYCQMAYEKKNLSKTAVEHEGMIQIQQSMDREAENIYYRGCRFDTPWITNMYEKLCEQDAPKSDGEISDALKDIKTPENILFFFDGAGDFNASRAFHSVSPVNIDGSEGVDAKMGNGNGLYALSTMMLSDHILKQKRKSIELHYHPGSGLKKRENYESAISCAEETKYYFNVLSKLKSEKIEAKWLVMGYSNGGALTIDFQNDVTKFDVNIDLAVAIDPISQAVLYPFMKLKDSIGKRNAKTKRFVTIYQDTDFGSLPGFKLRGKPVKDADVNLLLNSSNSYLDKTGEFNHVRIVRDPLIIYKTNCEFTNVLQNQSQNCGY